MRLIHTRQRVFKKDHIFENKMSLLVWVLSILKWKEYGYETVLYTDTKTLEDIKKFGFNHLYDVINTDLLEDKEVTKGIDFVCYWAMSKLLALRHETLTLGNDVVIADQDVVPMADISHMWTNSDVAVWSNKEHVQLRAVYPNLCELSLPYGYKLPKWFTGEARPLNTGILHIKNKDIVDLYTSEALKMAKDNHNAHKNTNCQTMCNAEQRMLGEIVEYKNLSYSVMQPVNKGLFNRNGFHTHGYKIRVNNDNGLLWHLNLLLMIKKCNLDMFNKLLENDLFKPEKEYFDRFGYVCESVKELEVYRGL